MADSTHDYSNLRGSSTGKTALNILDGEEEQEENKFKKSTTVQTLGELRMHGTGNWWAGLFHGLPRTSIARGESDTG